MTDEFEQLTRRLQDAVQQQNRTELEELVAEGFRLITSRAANPVGRAEWIEAAVGPFRVNSYSLSNFRVISVGDAAVVVHNTFQDAALGDLPAARAWLTTDVWTKATGRWQITARHAEALPD